MSSKKSTVTAGPLLPKPLSMPLKLLPSRLHCRALVSILNKVFANDLDSGELDFLLDRSVAIEVSDMSLSYRLMLKGSRFIENSKHTDDDLTIRASLYDFMSLASRKVDPDTLVFQRRLVMEGDTELGLALKNYLDALDIESSKVLSTIESFSRKLMPVYKKLFG